MEEALVVQSTAGPLGAPLGSPEQILSKITAFKEIANLVQSGFFPDGIKNVQQALAVCWISDALGVHPMIGIQNIVPIKQRPYVMWRLKLGLIKSHYPAAEFVPVSQDAMQCTAKARTGPKREWSTVTFTREQCRKNPVTSKNDLYESDWPDMSLKACWHRLADLIAPEVMMGLPSGDGLSEAPIETPAAPADPAAVLERAASGSSATVVPDEPKAADYPEMLKKFMRGVWGKQDAATVKRTIEFVLAESRGEKSVALPGILTPSDAKEALEHLQAKYPDGKLRPSGAVESSGAAPNEAVPVDQGAMPEPAAPDDPRNFDERHADEHQASTDEGVPLDEAQPERDPAVEAQEAADRAAYEADGKVTTIFRIASAAKKTFPSRNVVREAPKESGRWYFIDLAICQNLAWKTGPKIQDNGEQSIDAEKCRLIVTEMRKAGLEGPAR